MLVGICDDDKRIWEKLEAVCKKFGEQESIEMHFRNFESGEDVLQYCDSETEAKVDLLFLDIELDGISGIALKEQILDEYLIGKIVFVSSHCERMVDAFSDKTLGFVEKPIEDTKIVKLLQQVYQRNLSARTIRYFDFHGKSQYTKIDDILYCEGKGSYTELKIQKSSGTITDMISKRLGLIERELKKNGFIRVHKSFVVNISKIKSIDNQDEQIFIWGATNPIPLGRKYKINFLTEYKKFVVKQVSDIL